MGILPRLGILRIVEITSATTVVILKTSSTTSMLVVTASTSSSMSIELGIKRSNRRVVGIGGRAFVGNHSHMGKLFGVIYNTLEKIFFSLHQGM